MFPQGASRRLIAAFVLLLLLPAVAVVWLGVRLIVQDRQIESDQLRKQRERAAEQIVNALNERLSAAERNLSSAEPPGDDAVTLVLGPDGVDTRPAKRLLYRPGPSPGSPDLLQPFVSSEEFEYRAKDLGARFVYFVKRSDSRSIHELFRVPVNGGTAASMAYKPQTCATSKSHPTGGESRFR